MPYYWREQIEKNEMGEECSTFRGEERCVQGVVGKPERMRPLGKPRRRWKNNIKMDLEEVEWGGIDWIDRAQNRDP
jgi:hypothetical protein